MNQWHRQVQKIVEEIDACIRRREDETLTLSRLSRSFGYSADRKQWREAA